ncbi:MAG: YbhN family protein [Planctomycetota bacterium]
MIVKLAVGVGLVVWLVTSDKFDLNKLSDVRQRWGYFVAAQLLFFACFLVTVVRWKFLIQALGVPAKFRDALRLGMIGLFFNQVAFGSTGGDLIKAYYIARESPNRRAQAVLSVVLDRIVGLVSLMMLGGVALILNWKVLTADPTLRGLGYLLASLIVGILAGGALLSWESFWRRPGVDRFLNCLPASRVLRRLVESLWMLRGRRRRIFFGSIALSVLNHLGFVATHTLLAIALLGEAPSFLSYLFLIPVGQLAFALPITPGGLGVGEWAYDELFRTYYGLIGQVGHSEGLEIAALIRLTWIFWGLLGLVFYLRGRRDILASLEQAQEGIGEGLEHAVFESSDAESADRQNDRPAAASAP